MVKTQQELGSEEVMQFIETAERFCGVIERLDYFSEAAFLRQMVELLPLLYYTACRLPDYPWPDENDDSEESRRAFEHRKQHVDELRISLMQDLPMEVPIDDQLRVKLGTHDAYSFVFDPVHPHEGEALDGSLSEDIESVYSDVKMALDLYRSDDELGMREAIWDWSFGKKTHWGPHALQALSAIHWLYHQHYDEDDEVFDI